MLHFQLKSGKDPLTLEERFDQKQKENNDEALDDDEEFSQENLRFRTNSIPSVFRPHLKTEARRLKSLLPQKSERPKVHSSQWLTRTQQLLRTLRLREEHEEGNIPSGNRHHKHRLTRLSSRLTSHHSSSDEEWYSDLQLIPDSIENTAAESSEGTVVDTVKSIPPSSETDIVKTEVISETPPPLPSQPPPTSIPNTEIDDTSLPLLPNNPSDVPLNDTQDETRDKRKKAKCCTKCVVT